MLYFANEMIWDRIPNAEGHIAYSSVKNEVSFEIIKKNNKWYTSVSLNGCFYRNWQITKTLKAAKAACEDFAFYNL